MPRPPAVTLEDIVLLYEDGIHRPKAMAAELGCSVQAVYRAKRRHGLTQPPQSTLERLALLERCGWSEEDATWLVRRRAVVEMP